MHSTAPRTRIAIIFLVGAAYVAASMGTAALSGGASVKKWRLAAWLLSLAIFVTHFALERNRQLPRSAVAARVALAVAVGALGVAVLGPVRAHWDEPSRSKLILLSVVAWPVMTGAPAFVVALIGGMALDGLNRGAWRTRRTRRTDG